MVRFVRTCSLALALSVTSAASAAVTSFQPNPVDLNDLDHHMAYTWRIDNINLGTNEVVTGAQISFKAIENWDSSPNILYMHLLDSAKNGGVRSFVDDPTNSTKSTMIDDFINTRYHDRSSWLVAKGTADTFLTSRSFTTRPVDYIYTFTADQVKDLNKYIANGKDIALGFDPDCHFWNNGVKFTITTAAVPEPSAIFLLGGGIIGLFFRNRALRRRQAELDAELGAQTPATV